ncbi:SRPBCC family protein [Paenibacillus oenotherae]|uniref:SRPBCC family protein n=1 Tax=Paenibacillus oenotherae TaxID=1435645 RepID=A0ABS7DAF7_9BACL|nr:SRPBCC family protein [Paenibacillus oenotherae]MBW7476928.1 SRPBCC family protein [Paenibacillus oenotherae]
MIIIRSEIEIEAPIEICFDYARDIDIHTRTVWKHTRERAVAGRTSGMIEAGEEVTFEATHLLVRQRLTSRVTAYKRPLYFVDEMVSGAFKRLKHSREFTARQDVTIMRDELAFEAPFGMIGRLVERLVLKRYMARFIHDRNRQLKLLIEQSYKPLAQP